MHTASTIFTSGSSLNYEGNEAFKKGGKNQGIQKFRGFEVEIFIKTKSTNHEQDLVIF